MYITGVPSRYLGLLDQDNVYCAVLIESGWRLAGLAILYQEPGLPA